MKTLLESLLGRTRLSSDTLGKNMTSEEIFQAYSKSLTKHMRSTYLSAHETANSNTRFEMTGKQILIKLENPVIYAKFARYLQKTHRIDKIIFDKSANKVWLKQIVGDRGGVSDMTYEFSRRSYISDSSEFTNCTFEGSHPGRLDLKNNGLECGMSASFDSCDFTNLYVIIPFQITPGNQFAKCTFDDSCKLKFTLSTFFVDQKPARLVANTLESMGLIKFPAAVRPAGRRSTDCVGHCKFDAAPKDGLTREEIVSILIGPDNKVYCDIEVADSHNAFNKILISKTKPHGRFTNQARLSDGTWISAVNDRK